MNKTLNLETIKNTEAKAEPVAIEPGPVVSKIEDAELLKNISAANNAVKTSSPMVLNENDNRNEITELESLDEDIAKTENEKPISSIPVPVEDDTDKVINDIMKENESIDETKKEQKEADSKAKEYVEEMLSEENIGLDDDEIYKKKEKEKQDQEAREKSRKRYLELKKSYETNIVKKDLDDLKEYRISKSPVSVSKIFQADMTSSKIGAWGLFYSGRTIAVSEIGGPEMEIITQETSDNDLIDQVSTFEIIHKHIIDANKGTIEEYFKKFTYLDLRDLFFAIYKATYKGSNYGSFTCSNEKCGKMFMQPMKLKDMVVYPNKEVEERMQKIINQDPTSASTIKKKLIHISPDYAATIDIPSIYKVVFEQRFLPSEFRRKNEDLNNTLMYIDEIFYKDRQEKMLHNIDTKPDPNNVQLTTKRRVATYSKILSRLTSDQYAFLKQQVNEYISKYQDADKRIKYQLPEVKCPHCGTVIPAQEMDPLTMVFIRHQLGQLLNIREN